MAQTFIFNQEIKEDKLDHSKKLKHVNYGMFSKLKYCKQTPFALDKDLQISLFDGQSINIKYVSNPKLGLGTTTYKYTIEGDREGIVVFTDFKGWIDGSIILGTGEKFHIVKTADNIFSVSKINDSYFKDETCKADETHLKEVKDNNLNKNLLVHPNICTSSPCTNSVVDIMVLFSNQTIANINGGVSAAIAATANQVVLLNQSLIDSGINNLQYNLVHAQAINHNDLTDLSDDKDEIKYGTLSASVNALRNQYGADLVSIFCNYGSGTGDISTAPTNFSSDAAYSAINYDYVVGSYSLSHELGHNMGLRHDWYVYLDRPDHTRACEHYHGYVNKVAIQQGAASPANKRWRDIMSYGNECSSVGITCTRLNRWSNPDQSYNGDAMGVSIGSADPSDSRHALMRTGCIVAAYKTAPVLGVQNTQDQSNNFSYYPNPAKNKLFLSKEIKGYTIFNAEGRYIEGTNNKVKEINISYLQKGVYIVNTTLPDNKKYSFKFIKE